MGNWQEKEQKKKKKGASGGERANVSEKVKKQCEFGFKISIFCAQTKESCGDMLRKLIRISLRRNRQSQNDIAEWIPNVIFLHDCPVALLTHSETDNNRCPCKVAR